MTEKITRENLERLGFENLDVDKYRTGVITTTTIIKGNHIVIDGVKNIIYSGTCGARKYYFNPDNLKFPAGAPELIEEYYNIKLELYIKEKAYSNFPNNDLKLEFHEAETMAIKNKLKDLKDKYKVFSKHPEFLETPTRYLKWLKSKQHTKPTGSNTDDPSKEFKDTFENIFDSVKPKTVYDYFKKELVDTGYLTLPLLEDYLKCAFQDTNYPNEKFTFTKKIKSKVARDIWHRYYSVTADAGNGYKTRYAGLLGNYFIGDTTEKIYANFRTIEQKSTQIDTQTTQTT